MSRPVAPRVHAIAFAFVAACATSSVSAKLPTPVAGKIVFIGGVGPGYATLADPGVNAQMLASGSIGLYQHANGNAALSPAQREALWATWGARGTAGTAGPSVGEVGGFVPVKPGYLAYFGGRYPPEVNMNILTGTGDGTGTYVAAAGDAHFGRGYPQYTSVSDLVQIKHAIDAAMTHGARNVAVVMTPNGGKEDLDDPFANGGYWANVRAAALYGGGIGLDVPPSYWVARGPAYHSMIAQMIAWSNAHHLRTSLIVSPSVAPVNTPGDPRCGYDPAFEANTRRLAAALAKAYALPTQWVVENYSATAACRGSNDVATDATSNSLNAVSLYLARSRPVSPPGTATPGAEGAPNAGLLH